MLIMIKYMPHYYITCAMRSVILSFNLASISVDKSGEMTVCFNSSITITFTHVKLGGDSGYLPEIFWIKNGNDYVPDGNFENVLTDGTTTTLIVHCRRGFISGTTYQASIINPTLRVRNVSDMVNVTIRGE